MNIFRRKFIKKPRIKPRGRIRRLGRAIFLSAFLLSASANITACGKDQKNISQVQTGSTLKSFLNKFFPYDKRDAQITGFGISDKVKRARLNLKLRNLLYKCKRKTNEKIAMDFANFLVSKGIDKRLITLKEFGELFREYAKNNAAKLFPYLGNVKNKFERAITPLNGSTKNLLRELKNLTSEDSALKILGKFSALFGLSKNKQETDSFARQMNMIDGTIGKIIDAVKNCRKTKGKTPSDEEILSLWDYIRTGKGKVNEIAYAFGYTESFLEKLKSEYKEEKEKNGAKSAISKFFGSPLGKAIGSFFILLALAIGMTLLKRD